MVSWPELKSRVRDFYTFSPQEIIGLALSTVVTAFIFSFRDWGGAQFNLLTGLYHFLLLFLAAGIIFTFRFSCQKWYGLSEGYKVEYKPWWTGLVIALVICFLSRGLIPLVLIGGVFVIFMSKQRLGEFRYGFSYWQNGTISLWGIYSVMITAILFTIGLRYFPQSYFFEKGVFISLITGLLTLLPLPQQEGLNVY